VELHSKKNLTRNFVEKDDCRSQDKSWRGDVLQRRASWRSRGGEDGKSCVAEERHGRDVAVGGRFVPNAMPNELVKGEFAESGRKVFKKEKGACKNWLRGCAEV